MWPLSNNMDELFENIQKDIVAFANHGTLKIDRLSADKMELSWQERQLQKKAKFSINRSNQILVSFDSQQTDYHSFLSSSYMADLRYSAQQTLALLSRQIDYIQAHAKILPDVLDDSEQDQMTSNVRGFEEALNELINSPLFTSSAKLIEATHVIFLRGHAGTGKSVAVKELTRTQANEYLAGRSNFLFFYIDAQGRALARIDEAIALETQKYNFSFRHDAVNVLTRNGLIVPIIDGFDELIGSGGFADAFKSLSSFLSSLEKNGTLVATGRSTFYDLNVLSYIAKQYSNADNINYIFSTAEITRWTEEDIDKYISIKFNDQEIKNSALQFLNKMRRSNSGHSVQLLSKPFYCSKFAELFQILQLEGNEVSDTDITDASLLEYLIRFYVSREIFKFVNRQGTPILEEKGHRKFLQQLSLELWWQERRSIDSETVQTVAEIIAEEFNMQPEDQPIFIGKVSSYAMLKNIYYSGEPQLAFETPIYYDYFLLGALIDIIENDPENYLKQFLARSLFDDSILEQFAQHCMILPELKVRFYIDTICKSIERAPAGGLPRRNGGSLVCSILRNRHLENIKLHNLECYGESLEHFSTNNSTFYNCLFQDIKLYDTKLVNCNFEKTSFYKAFISENTSFLGSSIEPSKTINYIITSGHNYLDPLGIEEVIKKHGGQVPERKTKAPLLNEKQKSVLLLLQSFGEKSRSIFYFDIDSNEEPRLNTIMANPYWPILKNLLIEHSILEKKLRDRSGRRQYLYHIAIQPSKVISCITDNINCDSENLVNFVHDFNNL